MLEFTDNHVGRAVVVALKGKVDNLTADLFDAHCRQLLGDGEQSFVFDCTELAYLSSAGLRVVLKLAQVLAPGGKVAFAAMNETVREIFKVSGFEAMFHLYPPLESAVREGV